MLINIQFEEIWEFILKLTQLHMSSDINKTRSVDRCVYFDTELALCLREEKPEIPIVFCM